MTSKTWKGVTSYTLSTAGTFTFSAYAEDANGNKSRTLERKIVVSDAQVKESTPKISNMNFAANSLTYSLGSYITEIEKGKEFYLGFQIKDEDTDAKKIHLTIKDSYGYTIQNGNRVLTIDDMTSKTWKGGTSYTLSSADTFTFSAYAEDADGNKSDTVEKTLSITENTDVPDTPSYPSKPMEISMNFAFTNTDFINGNYVIATQIYLGIYIGIMGKNWNQDTKVYLTMIDSSGDIVGVMENLSLEILTLYGTSYSTGYDYYSFSKTGTYTISAYAKDYMGKKSKTVEKELRVVLPANLLWSETTNIAANSYKAKLILYATQVRTISANVTCEDGVKIYLLNKENYKLFEDGEPFEYYSDFSSKENTTSFYRRKNLSKGDYYFVVANESAISKKVAVTVIKE